MEPRYRLTMRICISDRHMGGAGLNVEEEFTFESLNGFTEMAKILGQFHDLAARVKLEKA